MKFELGKEQKEAIELIKDFISSNKEVFTLQGFAGTGKSTIIKEISALLENKYIPYILCAPTHRAKLVLQKFSEREAITLHKLLALSPNIEILELDFRDLMFRVNDYNLMFPVNGVIICDEASMINDYLFDLLLVKLRKFSCKIIFVGDKAQLRPVNAKYYSKVFGVEDTFTLEYIYRQEAESGLSAVLPILRNSVIPVFNNHIGLDGSVLCYNNVLSFFKEAMPVFKRAIRNADILETKMLAYTNNRVSALNEKIKELLFGNIQEYNKFEFLTGYDNIEFGMYKFWNSMDYIIIDEPIKKHMNIPFFGSLPGYVLNLYDSSTETSSIIFILSKEIEEDHLNSLAYTIESIRLDAIDLSNKKSRRASLRWKDYYKLMGSFATPDNLCIDDRVIRKKSFDYGYASTVHKSQGLSINNVFIDMKDVSICRDKEELRQLQYVGVSRARKNAHILQ